jgi:hypothetical protein
MGRSRKYNPDEEIQVMTRTTGKTERKRWADLARVNEQVRAVEDAHDPKMTELLRERFNLARALGLTAVAAASYSGLPSEDGELEDGKAAL